MILFLTKGELRMIVLPFATNEEIYCYELSFQNMMKEEQYLQAHQTNRLMGDIRIGKARLSETNFQNEDKRLLTEQIRKYILSTNQHISYIQVTSRNYKDSDFCDNYTLPAPPLVRNRVVDYLYGFFVTNLMTCRPDDKKSYSLSLEKAGVKEILTEAEYRILEQLCTSSDSKETMVYRLKEAGFGLDLEVLSFFSNLKIKKIEGSVQARENLEKAIQSFGVTDSKEGKTLEKYIANCEKNTTRCLYYLEPLSQFIERKSLGLTNDVQDNAIQLRKVKKERGIG